MRKVTAVVCQAFLDGKPKSLGNTSTDGQELRLHGNRIAAKCGDGISVTMAGWGSVTTRERLNGLLSLMGSDKRFYQRNHTQHFDGRSISPTDEFYVSIEK